MSTDALLLEESIRRKLDQLMFTPSKIRAGAIKGERRSTKRGTSIEFADYRNYSPGDDLRRLDWNVYARLERPYIKLLEDEEDLAVHVILDNSASMNFPEEGEVNYKKSLFSKRLLAGLGYISLITNDRLMLAAVNDHGFEYFGPARGRSQVVSMLKFVHAVEPRGVTDLNVVLKDYSMREKRPGLVFVISDMFSATGFIDGLNSLIGKGHEVVMMHVLSEQEVNPQLSGDLRLVDVETDVFQEISVDATMLSIYLQRLEAWQTEIRVECTRRGVNYLPLVTNTPWERTLLYDLRRIGIIK